MLTLDQVIEAAKIRDYDVMELIYDGSSEFNGNPRSYVYRMGNFCIKYYIRTLTDYRAECANLQKLAPYGFAPKLYYGSEQYRFIIMEFINGTPLGKVELTNDQKAQLETIHRQLHDLKIYHEKERIHCIIEPSGKVRMVDFNI